MNEKPIWANDKACWQDLTNHRPRRWNAAFLKKTSKDHGQLRWPFAKSQELWWHLRVMYGDDGDAESQNLLQWNKVW